MRTRAIFVTVAGVEALAVAIWLIPASLHVVAWPASGPARVALFAPQARLLWLVIAALVAATAILVPAGRTNRSRRLTAVFAPLSVLWLWTIPYLPWLPDRVPTLLVLAGPVRWLIAALAVAGAIAGAPAPRARSVGFGAESNATRVRRFVFAGSLILYAVLGLLNAREVGPGGDEPHYLIISQSLLADGDLKIENNHQRRDYRAFWGSDLRPDYMKRGIDGEIYSIHAPGLPVVLLPAYGALGYRGTVLVLCLIAALTSLAVFDVAHAMAGPVAALWTWMAVCLTVPFVPHAWLIFPEMPGALVVAWGIRWIVEPAGPDRPSEARWLVRGVAFATLPWLHTKFIIFAAIFGAAFVWRLRAQVRTLAAFVTPIALSIAGWLYFFWILYGSLNPEAPYGDYPAINVLAKNIPRGLLGLLFDQKFGLLFYSPIYLFVVAGFWRLVRRAGTRFLAAVLFTVIAVHLGSTTRLYMWWGGTSAPARFLVPILPCLAPMIAVAVLDQTRVTRSLFRICLAVSLLVAIVGTGWPGRLFLYSDSRGYARLLETIQNGAPLTFSLPTFTVEDWVTPIRTLVPWLLAAGIGLAAIATASRWLRSTMSWMAATGIIVLLVSADLLAARPDAGARDELARRGVIDLIWQYDAARLRPFEYGSLEKIDETRVRDVSHVVFNRLPIPGIALPEGAYEARVWFAGALPRLADLAVSAQRVTFGRTAGVVQTPAVIPFELPVAVGRVTVVASGDTPAASITRIEIAPTRLMSKSARERRSARRIEEVPERPQAYLIYVDDSAFPENGVFWTRATQRAEVLVARGPYSSLRMTLHLGPRSGDVQVTVAGREQTVRVEANGTADVEFPLGDAPRLVPVAIQSPTTFRPMEVDPASEDARTLGVQVRVSLE